jgi:pimeloyl-ACP methyl ester carboxylesterase
VATIIRPLYALWQRGLSDWPAADDLLSLIAAPCLLYAGELDAGYDGVKEAAKHIPDASFISIPGLAHSEAFERSDPILPHVKRFLSRVTS